MRTICAFRPLKARVLCVFVVNGRSSRSAAAEPDVVAKVKFARSFGSRDVLSEIELIEQPKQLAARGPDSGHLVGAGQFRRKFLLPENEDFKLGYGVHSVPCFHPEALSAALP
jgi:hypothetical protein